MNLFNHPLLALRKLSTFVMLAVILGSASAQTRAEKERNKIASLLEIHYVAYPNSKDKKTELLDNKAILAGKLEGTFWKQDGISDAQRLVKGLFRPTTDEGDRRFQYVANKVLKILDKPVIVYLIDDRMGVNEVARNNYGVSPSGGKAWPVGTNMASDDDVAIAEAKCRGLKAPKRRDEYAGYMSIGVEYLDGRNRRKAFGTFIHELTHTQDFANWRAHQFWVGGVNHSYGADGSHFSTEVIPNMGQAYKEGLANAFKMMYYRRDFDRFFDWYADGGIIKVEIPPFPEGSGPGSLHKCIEQETASSDIWLYHKLKRAGIEEAKARQAASSSKGEYAKYRISDLPPKYLVHNEMILAMIMYSYMDHISFSRFIYQLRSANKKLYRNKSGSGIGELFHALCKSGLASNESLQGMLDAGMTPEGPKPYMLPVAYVDFFTGYRIQSMEEFAEVFENHSQMKKWVELYWMERDHIRLQLDITQPKIEDLTEIATLLQIFDRSE